MTASVLIHLIILQDPYLLRSGVPGQHCTNINIPVDFGYCFQGLVEFTTEQALRESLAKVPWNILQEKKDKGELSTDEEIYLNSMKELLYFVANGPATDDPDDSYAEKFDPAFPFRSIMTMVNDDSSTTHKSYSLLHNS
jgi:hypothetical protein